MARAAAGVLADRDGTARPVAVVGRDPRASGEMLEAAVVAGLTSAGAEVLRAGVLPTPALAHLTAATDADLGVMISASHNPMPDNGIKLFSRGGHKLPDALEAAIERTVDRGDSAGAPAHRCRHRAGPGPARRDRGLRRAPALHARPAADRADGGRRRCARRRAGERPRGLPAGRGHGARDRLRARRLEHQRRHRLHAPRPADRGRARPRRRPRPRPRRRRRPLPRGDRRGRGHRRRRDPGDLRAGAARARRAQGRHRRRHRHEQPRLPPHDARRRDRRAHDRGGRPLRAGGPAGARALARR